MQSPSTTKELEQLRAQYGVTVKVVKAQGEYISDLESKNLALTKHLKEQELIPTLDILKYFHFFK